MKTVCLFGGEGTRMQPLTLFTNKSLLRIGGFPICSIIINKLKFGGINTKDIILACHKKNYYDYAWEFRDVDLNICPMDATYGTATYFFFAVIDMIKRDLKFTTFSNTSSHERFSMDTRLLHDAIEAFSLSHPSIMVHYGDVITDLDYAEFMKGWNEMTNNGLDNTMTGMIAITKNIRHDYSLIKTSETGQYVTDMIEKPKLSSPSWTGIAVFNTKKILTLLAGRVDWVNSGDNFMPTYVDFAYDILPNMARNQQLASFLYDGEWFDIGNLNSYNKLARQAMDNPVGMMTKLYGADNVANKVLQTIKVPVTGLV